ncbi:DNA helicase [Salmonella phage 21]|nr:DNA helicase [Salmonella phage 21]
MNALVEPKSIAKVLEAVAPKLAKKKDNSSGMGKDVAAAKRL